MNSNSTFVRFTNRQNFLYISSKKDPPKETAKKKHTKEKQPCVLWRCARLIKKYGKRNALLILDEKVEIGFTKQMCIEAWGEPQDINRTITRNRVHEQWVYGIGCYLYFEGNYLTAIQN